MTKKQIKSIVLLMLVLLITLSSIAYATATKDAYVYHMHTDDYRDATYFKDLLDDKNYTTNTYYGSAC